MVKATLAASLFFSLAVLLSVSVYADPVLVENTGSVQDQYNPSTVYIFSSTWNATLGENITACNFILGRPDGSITNYTSDLNSTVSPSLCSINFTQDQLGPAGPYNWSWSAKNDTEWTVNDTFDLNLSKAGPLTIHLLLNGTESNKNSPNGYSVNDTANFSVSLNTSSVPYIFAGNAAYQYLYSNFTSWVNQNISNLTYFEYPINLNKSGLFYVLANWSGDQNYSMANQTYFFTAVDLRWSANSSLISSPIQYLAMRNYSFQINLTGNVSKVLFEWNGNNTTYTPQNNSSTYWVNMTDLAAGNYTYRWFANDTGGLFSYTDLLNYSITAVPTTLSFSATPTSVSTGGSVSFSCSITNNPLPNLTVTLNLGTCTGLNSFSSCAVTTSSVADTYSYICTALGNGNYTTSSSTQFIIVSSSGSSSTTTPGSSSGGSSSGSFSIVSLAGQSVAAGESISTSFSLSNTLSNNIVNVSISVTGIDASWYTLSNKSISILQKTIPKTLSITFKIPSDAQANEYNVTIKAVGKMLGETSTRSTSKTMTLNVTGPKPIAPLDINGTLETTEPVASTYSEHASENLTENSTLSEAPPVTGLMSTFQILQNNLVFIVAVAACLLIFIFRGNVTSMIRRDAIVIQREEKNIKMPALPKYKITIGLKKEDPSDNLVKTETASKRPDILEREIKRDMKELQNIIENEKKMKKKQKIENN